MWHDCRMTKQLIERASAWMASDPDPQTRAATEELIAHGDEAALELAFGARLEFGTAGIRGKLGPGPGHMNRALVQKVTRGLADYLLRELPDAATRGVVVGHDARIGSVEFAADTCAVLSGAGIRVIRLKPLAPTPMVAFAALELNAAAAVCVTASHNPPEYNGYKVYWANGAQIIPPHDAGIAACIDAVDGMPTLGTRIDDAPGDLEQRYLAAVAAQAAVIALPDDAPERVIAYTPMHGVGAALGEVAMRAQGVVVHTVEEQRTPDGRFPTVAFPNPEEAGAMDRVMALGDRVGAHACLAHDPDADRMALAIRADGRWRMLTGDQIGALLGSAILSARSPEENRAMGAIVGNSIVSCELLSRIAAHHGATHFTTLTGFKWIWNDALDRIADGARFVFGYEEAIGYAVGPVTRDKDGIGAGATFARILRSGDPWDALVSIFETHGFYGTRQKSIVDAEPGGVERHTQRMAALRKAAPTSLAGVEVERVVDFKDGAEGLPPSNLVGIWLTDGTRVMIRPSGTEPKLKVYLQVVEAWGALAERRADERLTELAVQCLDLVMKRG